MIITVIAMLFLAMGLGALIVPRSFLAVFDIQAGTAAARNEIQAVYGGYGIAMCALLWWSRQQPQWAEGIWLTVAVALAGMAAGRLMGLVREPTWRWPVWLFLAIEAGLALLLFRQAGVI
ncbi:hypothetical protein S7S_04315 [Isoalcanivorax pacificus W11-5]|uniref:DUF4345 domain-containing protein n=1 Tax=Isoalcanivorax pacificus W11-5 TaxID=391936 RepID=A0A0B4XKS4_9GAMM|nr:DUF4345 family protein [Isoalcanivorax pacificus]AJD47285.1 hypothetical protein S7S_04315 [Isoalcanivorax pacificus W11-5]